MLVGMKHIIKGRTTLIKTMHIITNNN